MKGMKEGRKKKERKEEEGKKIRRKEEKTNTHTMPEVNYSL